jgi:hypothetical protein
VTEAASEAAASLRMRSGVNASFEAKVVGVVCPFFVAVGEFCGIWHDAATGITRARDAAGGGGGVVA